MKDIFTKLRQLYLWELNAFYEWKHEIWSRDLDERYCCDGKECGCGGMTIRETLCSVEPRNDS